MHLIFDFDGTLADSFSNVKETFNTIAEELNLEKIPSSELIKLKDLSSQQLIKFLKIPLHKLPAVIYKARKHMNRQISTLPPFLNIRPVLQKLYDAQYVLGILSSNSLENLTTWLRHNNMAHFFSFIHVESNYFGKSKVLKKILKKYKINESHAYYIGDETRDVDAAKKNNINSIAVTWGFNSEKVLLEHQPDHIARKAEDLLTLFGFELAC